MYKLQAFPVAFNIQHMESVYTKSLYYTRRSIRYMYIHTNLPTCFEIKHRNNSTLLTYTILKKKIKRKKILIILLYFYLFFLHFRKMPNLTTIIPGNGLLPSPNYLVPPKPTLTFLMEYCIKCLSGHLLIPVTIQLLYVVYTFIRRIYSSVGSA